jgi:hypothetical protein
MYKLLVFLFLVTSACAVSQKGKFIKMSFAVLDKNDCKVEFEISDRYRKLLKNQLVNNKLDISKELLCASDTIFIIRVPDSMAVPTIFITSEFLQINKTPIPDSLSQYIIKQYKYYKTEIKDISITSMKTVEKVDVSKLSFTIVEGNIKMVNYVLFVNNRSVTIGISSHDESKLPQFDGIIKKLKIICN